jgi:dihydropyrimidinase
MALDLIIKGGTVVTPAGVGASDVGVQGEKIVLVSAPGAITIEAKKTIDATGKIVVPGGIEAHAHVGHPGVGGPGAAGVNAGVTEQSRGALWGGTTTVVDFTPSPDEGDVLKAVYAYMEDWKGKAFTDYNTHVTYRGTSTVMAIDQIKDLIAAGFTSIKIFTTSVRPPTPDRPTNRTDMGRLAAVMTECAKHGGIVAVHSEDDDIVQYNYARAKERGWLDWWNMHLVHSNLSEDLSFRRVTRVAEKTGGAMYFVHTSAKEGVNAIAEARSKGLPVYGETLNTYCSFNADNYKESDGMKYHTYPSLKFEDDRLRLWDGLLHGDMTFMATDSIATTYANKILGRSVLDVQGGNIGIEIRMGITYKEGVIDKGMSLERYVDITSTNVAKVLGFYPQKGAIAAGSDADITIIDPAIKKRLAMSDLHVQDYSSWEKHQIEGWPSTVILRGHVMIEERKLVGRRPIGQLVRRKIDPLVLNRPMC